MAERITTFLMLEGRLEEAMNFYVALFPDSGIDRLERHGPDGPGAEGSLRAAFTVNGMRLMGFDSPAPHSFTFTPSISLFVDCDSEEEIDWLFAALSEGGTVNTQTPYIVIDNVDGHAAQARAAGAEIIVEPADQDYGGRVYSARDPEGYVWSFGSYDPWAPAGD